MMTRVVGAYELGAPFGALGCGMAMHDVHVVSRQPRTVVILSSQLLADPGSPRQQAEQSRQRSVDVTMGNAAGGANSGNSGNGGGDSSSNRGGANSGGGLDGGGN